MSTTIEEAMRSYYHSSGVLTASRRELSPLMERRLTEWRKDAVCRGCGQRIAEHVGIRQVGFFVFHESCGQRAAAVSVPTVKVPTAAPAALVGTLRGVALTFGVPCLVRQRQGFDYYSEQFDLNAFDDSIRRGAAGLRVGHDGADLQGRMTLRVDAGRLCFAFEVRDTPAGREALRVARSGGFSGCSVAFQPRRERFASRVNLITVADLQHVALCDPRRSVAPQWYGTHVAVV